MSYLSNSGQMGNPRLQVWHGDWEIFRCLEVLNLLTTLFATNTISFERSLNKPVFPSLVKLVFCASGCLLFLISGLSIVQIYLIMA
jgi:hypothetical protein